MTTPNVDRPLGDPSGRDKPLWRHLNAIEKAYLQMQKKMVAFDLIHDDMLNEEMVDAGLMVIEESVIHRKVLGIEEGEVGEEEGKPIRARKFKLISTESKEEEKKVVEQIKALKKYLVENNEAFTIMDVHARALIRQEQQMLKESVTLFEGTALWKWCLSVRGLGEVAGMTLSGIMNLDECKSVNQLYSYLGLTPFQRMRRGEQGGYNKNLKGRIWMICNNVILAQDPYYVPFYTAKKHYLTYRPDLIALKDGLAAIRKKMIQIKKKTGEIINKEIDAIVMLCNGCYKEPAEYNFTTDVNICKKCRETFAVMVRDDPELTPEKMVENGYFKEAIARRPQYRSKDGKMHYGIKGWKGKINNMTLRFWQKLLLAHAFELAWEDHYGMRWSDDPSHTAVHRNTIPIKPEDILSWPLIHETFRTSTEKLLSRNIDIWNEDKSPQKEKYFFELKNSKGV